MSLLTSLLFMQEKTFGQGAICVKISPDAQCPVSKSEFQKNQAQAAADISEAPDPRNGHGSQKKSGMGGTIGVSGTYSEDFTLINIPVSVPLAPYISMDAALSYLKVGSLEGMGNSYLGLSSSAISSSRRFGIAMAIGLRLPTGHEELGGNRKVADRHFSLGGLLSVQDHQFLPSILVIIRPEDNLNQDLGDTRLIFFGYDRSLSKLFGFYSGIESLYTGASYYQDRMIQAESLDLSVSGGLTTSFYDLRLGITLPIVYSHTSDPETGEKLEPGPSIDGGFRYDL